MFKLQQNLPLIALILVANCNSLNALFNCDNNPSKCSCYSNEIDCVQTNLIKIPIFSPFIVKLNLSHNEINKLEPNALRHLSLLQNLDLSFNEIVFLINYIFSGLGNLNKLYLNHNRINRIDKDAFKSLHQLQELHLHQNNLLHLAGDVFNDLPKLTKLTIINWPTISNQFKSSMSDDRRVLCNCPLVRNAWRIKNNFRFCKIMIVQQLQSKDNQPKCKLIFESINSNGTFPNTQTFKSKPSIQNQLPMRKFYVNTRRIETAAKLNVPPKSPPMLLRSPDSLVRAISGSKIVWTCEADGSPEPEYRWLYRNTNQLLSSNNTLILDRITPDSEGNYECFASNDAGIAAKEVKLLVIGGQTQASALSEPRRILKTIVSATITNDVKVMPQRTAPTMLRNITQFMEVLKLLMRYSDNENEIPSVSYVGPNNLTPVQQMVMNNYTGCVGGSQMEVVDCKEHTKYRAVTGVCNNLKYPLIGSSIIPFVRLLPANYEDGLAKPVGWFTTRKYANHLKPKPRDITSQLLSTNQITTDPNHNHMLMQFGQFLDHDIDFTAISNNINVLEDELLDCTQTCNHVEPCFSIEYNFNKTSRQQSSYKRNCIEMIRSAELCGSGYTSIVFGKLSPREQVNKVTSFIDGSNIYGSTVELAHYLRDLNSNDGLLKTFTVDNRTYLPLSNEYFSMDCQLRPRMSFLECFLAGDHRANEQIGLLTFHNIWFRHHNNLALRFRALKPRWSSEQIYQETKKIVGAQLQIITYRDWLPSIVGAKGMQMLGDYHGYNEMVDPSIANVFATAAMRFGHTLVNKHLIRKLSFSNSKQIGMKLRGSFFSPHLLFEPKVLDSIVNGLLTTPLKQPNPVQAISSELTDHLFEQSRHVPLDLASINIQRGRDHALPGYNDWRAFCSLNRAKTFDDFQNEIKNPNIRAKLRKLYSHPDNVDIWVGGILEDAYSDSKVGPTFQCLLVNQFAKLRDGDRFFFMNQGIFTIEQLEELKKTTLAKVICTNGDHIKTTIANAFLLPKHQTWVECDSLADLDLSKW